MSAISSGDDAFFRPDQNATLAYREAIATQTLRIEPRLSDDAVRIGPRSRLGVRYAPGQHYLFDDPPGLHCEWDASVAEGGGCFGFLMTTAIGSVKKKNLGNKPRHRPISCS